jgi:hypothetical protein
MNSAPGLGRFRAFYISILRFLPEQQKRSLGQEAMGQPAL